LFKDQFLQGLCFFKGSVSIHLKFEEFEDTKGVFRIPKSKKDRQHNGQNKKDKRTNNYSQNITHETKDRGTRILLKTGGELMCSGRVNSSCSIRRDSGLFNVWRRRIQVYFVDRIQVYWIFDVNMIQVYSMFDVDRIQVYF
jgi:hypothetical protein